MSLIEGIGDEVMVLATVLVIATTMLIAWFSTHVGERPPPRILIQTTIRNLQGRQQTTTENASTTEGSSEVAGGEGTGENEDIPASGPSASSEAGEGMASERTSNEAVAPLSQSTDNDSSVGIQSDASRTKEPSSVQNTCDEVDSSNIVQSGEKTDTNVELLGQYGGESSSISHGEDNSTTTAGAENQRSSDSLNQNVLRNRQTGQTYPTLPTFSSEATQGATAAPSERLVEETNGVEDIGSNVPGDEDSRRTQEGSISIRVKFSNDTERLVLTYPDETLGQFRRQNFVDELEAGKLVRFIANGQFLADDTQTLTSLNLTNNSVLHCHVTQGEPIRQSQQQTQDGDLDLGHFMVPLFGCILGFVWYLRWQYRYMFNATSTLSLIGVTVLFFLAVLAAWRG